MVNPVFHVGLTCLARYLAAVWKRAGILSGKNEDCTQSVYLSLLENLGRERFDGFVIGAGETRSRLGEIFASGTVEGLFFRRAVATVKTRARRERSGRPIDEIYGLAEAQTVETSRRMEEIYETVNLVLSRRETFIIQETLKGKRSREIAYDSGLTAKTVSNGKSIAVRKLRNALASIDRS